VFDQDRSIIASYLMKQLLKCSWRAIDKAMSFVIWLNDSIMLYICLLWLLPLCGLVVISLLIYDIRPLVRDQLGLLFVYSMLGLPPWLGFCFYTQLRTTPATQRIKDWMRRAPVHIGLIVLGTGALLWLLGV
jgi:hypothetical protein